MLIRLLKPHLDYKAGDVIDVAKVAADKFINSGWAERVQDGKALLQAVQDKAIKSPKHKKAATE